MLEVLSTLGALLLGLVLGTVVASWSLRIPGQKALFAAPHCVRSGEALALADYLPLIGYQRQRGVCRHCGKPLPRWFPLVEGSMAALTLLALAASDSWLRFAIYTGYMFVLLLIIAIDVRLHEIYTLVLVGGAAIALLAALVLPDMNVLNALGGGVLGGVFFFLFYLLARAIYKTEALGFGDVLLAILLGMISGFPGVISPLFWGPFIGGAISVVLLITRRKGLRDYFPYAPGLCIAQIAFLLTHLSNEPIWDTLRLPVLTYVFEASGSILWQFISKVLGL